MRATKPLTLKQGLVLIAVLYASVAVFNWVQSKYYKHKADLQRYAIGGY